MAVLVMLLAAGLTSYVLRVTSVGVPTERFPAAGRTALTFVGPAAMAALAAAAVVRGVTTDGAPIHLPAAAVAVVVARRTGNTGLTVAAALAVAVVCQWWF